MRVVEHPIWPFNRYNMTHPQTMSAKEAISVYTPDIASFGFFSNENSLV